MSCSLIKQRCAQALDCEVTTIESVLAEVLDWSPLNACHIDIGSNLSRSAWVERWSNLCECDKILCILDQNLCCLGIAAVSLVNELRELANSTYIDRLNRAVELNGHLVVSLGIYGNQEGTIVTCRNCNIYHLSLSAKYQTLSESYGNLI